MITTRTVGRTGIARLCLMGRRHRTRIPRFQPWGASRKVIIRMSKTHNIKLKEMYADAVLRKEKTFEIRYNDRNYKEGDIVIFQVVDDDNREPIDHPLNGKEFVITYMLRDFGLQEDMVAFGIKMLKEDASDDELVPDATPIDYTAMTYDDYAESPEDQCEACQIVYPDETYAYSGLSPEPPQQPQIDPNTQCVDCRYGTPMTTPDGVAKSIRCEVYYGQMRSPQDTCIANIVDMNSFTVPDRDDKG